MIELDKILNTDAAYTLREALCSHVYFQLSDEKYRNNGYVSAPGSDDPDMVEKIWEACELDEVLSGIVEYESCVPALLDELRAAADVPTYRCACSWVGGDPDIGKGRGKVRYTFRSSGTRFVMRTGTVDTKAPTCPACWAKNKKRVIVEVDQSPCKCCGLDKCQSAFTKDEADAYEKENGHG